MRLFFDCKRRNIYTLHYDIPYDSLNDTCFEIFDQTYNKNQAKVVRDRIYYIIRMNRGYHGSVRGLKCQV